MTAPAVEHPAVAYSAPTGGSAAAGGAEYGAAGREVPGEVADRLSAPANDTPPARDRESRAGVSALTHEGQIGR